MSQKRALDPHERALWERVMATVKPLHASKGRAAKGNAVRTNANASPTSRVARKSIGGMVADVRTDAHPLPTRDAFAQMLAAPVQPKPAVKAKPAPTLHRIDHHPTPIDGGLDGHWDRRLTKGAIIPDVSVDLHGLGLAHAHARLDGVLEQSIRSGARVILLVTGKLRDHDRASGLNGEVRRGAIRAAVTDWLAASRHHAQIASVRAAHQRHGGDGALYIILKRRV